MPSTVINSCNDTITQYNVQTGTGLNTLNQVAPSATSGIALISQGSSAQPIFGTVGVAGGGTGDTSFTPYAIIAAGTTSTGSLQNVSGVGTSGQVLTSSGASALPTWQTTGSGGTSSFTTDVLGPVTPNAGVVTVTGTNIYSDGTVANTLTLNTQGTAHSLFVAQGTHTPSTNLATGSSLQVLQSSGASADPAWSTATYPSTTTVSQLLYSSANNTVAGLATVNRAVITTTATGVPIPIALTNGQIIIGSTAGAPAAGTLNGGTGMTIVNGSNSIILNCPAWNSVSGSGTALTKQAYFINGGGTYTLPSVATDGDAVQFLIVLPSTFTIKGNTGQFIRLGLTISASAGTCVSSDLGSSITLVYKVSASTWFATTVVGSWTVT